MHRTGAWEPGSLGRDAAAWEHHKEHPLYSTFNDRRDLPVWLWRKASLCDGGSVESQMCCMDQGGVGIVRQSGEAGWLLAVRKFRHRCLFHPSTNGQCPQKAIRRRKKRGCTWGAHMARPSWDFLRDHTVFLDARSFCLDLEPQARGRSHMIPSKMITGTNIGKPFEMDWNGVSVVSCRFSCHFGGQWCHWKFLGDFWTHLSRSCAAARYEGPVGQKGVESVYHWGNLCLGMIWAKWGNDSFLAQYRNFPLNWPPTWKTALIISNKFRQASVFNKHGQQGVPIPSTSSISIRYWLIPICSDSHTYKMNE